MDQWDYDRKVRQIRNILNEARLRDVGWWADEENQL